MGPCASYTCEFGGLCVERSGKAVCECPVCPAEFDPACGSDGISYGNECKLRLEACQHTRKIDVLYKGLCNGCENKKCDHYAICESDGSGTAKCVCPETTSRRDTRINESSAPPLDPIRIVKLQQSFPPLTTPTLSSFHTPSLSTVPMTVKTGDIVG
ncbi:unnamed protein product [Timema podura]|uniref:Kazal-like domain-containing protein n=1 Tax=Timema podura TaxID=61482 RepID=A0ABN7P6P0_TIMPD|nr:unnamed protein product [Timema podura]